MSYDKPGMSRAKRAGSSPHNLSKEKSPHDEVIDQFARELAKSLKFELKKNADLKLRIIAEPRLLGKIRSFFGKFSMKARLFWLVKDLEKVPKQRWPRIIGVKSKIKPPQLASRFPI